jgi:hypothetical protein
MIIIKIYPKAASVFPYGGFDAAPNEEMFVQ